MNARKLLALAVAIAAVVSGLARVEAQVVPAQTFTAAGLDASPQQSSNCNTGTLQVSGTGTWTIVPQGSNDNGLTYNTITTINSGSITTAGTFSGAVAGFAASYFRFNVTAVTGSVSITKSCTSQQLQGSGGGGGGGSVTQGTVPWLVAGQGTAGTPAAGVVTVQGIAGGVALSINGLPGVSTTATAPPAGTNIAYVQGTGPGGAVPVTGTFSATITQPYGAGSSQTALNNTFSGSGGVYNATTPTFSNGAFVPLQFNASGNLLTAPAGQYNSTAPTLTNGALSLFQLDSSGNLNVNVKAGGSSGSSFPYSALAFGQTATAASVLPGGGVYNATPPPSLTNGQVAPFSLDVNGNLKVTTTATVAGYPYSYTNAQTATAASALGTGCFYNGTTAPTLTSGQFQPNLCDASGNQLVSGNVNMTSANHSYTELTNGSINQGVVSTVNDGASGSGGFTTNQSFNMAYQRGTTFWGRESMDNYNGGPLWTTWGGNGYASLTASGSIKATAGRAVQCITTVAATTAGTITLNDATSAGSGNIVGGIPTANQTTAFAVSGPFNVQTTTGIYFNDAATGGTFVCSYY